MSRKTLTQIADILGVSYTTLDVMLTNDKEFNRVIGFGKSKYYVINEVFFENLKKQINKKIKRGFTVQKYKDVYLKVIEWEQKHYKKLAK